MSEHRRGFATSTPHIAPGRMSVKGGNVILIVWVTAYFAVAIPATVLMGHFLAFCHSEEDDGS
jgi:hypothetical protein